MKELADWCKESLSTITQIAIAVASALIAVGGYCYRLVKRIDSIESEGDYTREKLDQFSDDLRKHQEEDREQFAFVHEQGQKLFDRYDALAAPVAKTAEAVGWIKQTLEEDRSYVHERIAEHDARNREGAKEYEREIEKLITANKLHVERLETEIATLKAKGAARRRRT